MTLYDKIEDAVVGADTATASNLMISLAQLCWDTHTDPASIEELAAAGITTADLEAEYGTGGTT